MGVHHFIPIFLAHITVAQFPDHVDLQKVGKIIFNNEEHKILKPTIHKITDHFVDFMQRSNKNNNERVFLDDNGFRHFWSGFGGKSKNLRKTDVYAVNSYGNDAIDYDSYSNNRVEVVANANSPEAVQPNEDVENVEVENTEAKDNQNDNSEMTATDEKLHQLESKGLKNSKETGLRNANAGKKKVKISFFCPFFGVITTTKFID